MSPLEPMRDSDMTTSLALHRLQLSWTAGRLPIPPDAEVFPGLYRCNVAAESAREMERDSAEPPRSGAPLCANTHRLFSRLFLRTRYYTLLLSSKAIS
ncbi:unnamed protein product, partial [Iphiclides podalirius]